MPDMKKITPDQAAYVMGCSAQFVRIGLQRGLLDIGDAVSAVCSAAHAVWDFFFSSD